MFTHIHISTPLKDGGCKSLNYVQPAPFISGMQLCMMYCSCTSRVKWFLRVRC